LQGDILHQLFAVAVASNRIDEATIRIVDTAAIAWEDVNTSFSWVIDNTIEVDVKETVP
jgi:chloramphenicol O-acetyltransferase